MFSSLNTLSSETAVSQKTVHLLEGTLDGHVWQSRLKQLSVECVRMNKMSMERILNVYEKNLKTYVRRTL